MGEDQPTNQPISLKEQELAQQVSQLRQQLQAVQQEKSGLEMLLSSVTQQYEQNLSEVQQEKADLEALLKTIKQRSEQLLMEMQQEKDDLSAMLETVTQHGDRILLEVQQEKGDLEVLLETITEHSDQTLAEMKQEKTDLEILLETTTEHSDVVAMELHLQAEEERRQREEQFRLITAATPVALLVSQIIDGKILYANNMAGVTFGVSPVEDLLGRFTPDFYSDPVDRRVLLQSLNQEQAFDGEIQLRRANGMGFWALMSVRPFRFHGANALLIALYDITDRKQAEEALRIAEAKYRNIFVNAVEGIFQSTPEGRYIDVNPALASLLGYASPDEMIEAITDIAHHYVDPTCRDEFRYQLETHDEIKGFEYQIRRKDGRNLWVSEWARTVRDANGQLLYYEGSCIDITQRKQEEEALKQQLQDLKVEIDHAKRSREVAAIVETDYFQQLLEEADQLRFNDSF